MQLMPLEVECYGISDIGLSRPNNEDIWAEIPEIRFYALADGMGGHQAGEVAAKEAVLELCDVVDDFFAENPKPTPEKVAQNLKEGFRDANKWVRTLAAKHPELSGMGTTLCCFCVIEGTLIHAHVGDSRIYQYRNKKLSQLSEDHSLRQELLSVGDLDEKSAASFPHKNVITRAIGVSSSLQAAIGATPVQSGDIYFLCSDGLTDYVPDSAIEAILRKSASTKEAAIELVEAAKAAGGNDNITIVIIKII
jgi:protein phosphatase